MNPPKCKLCPWTLDVPGVEKVRRDHGALDCYELITLAMRLHWLDKHPSELSELDRKLRELDQCQ